MENTSKFELGLLAYDSFILIALCYFSWRFGILVFGISTVLIILASILLWLFWTQPVASEAKSIGDNKLIQFISPEISGIFLSLKKSRRERLEMFTLIGTIALIIAGFYLYTTAMGLKPSPR
jgi:hypothetical protein